MTKLLRTVAFGIVFALCCPDIAGTQDQRTAREIKAAQAAVAAQENRAARELKAAAAAEAQDQKAAPEQLKAMMDALRERPKEIVPLRVQVVISRYDGEKKTSSLPYSLSVNANALPGVAQLRMGAEVPVSTMGQPPWVDGKQMPAVGPITYQHIGTNIDCGAKSFDDGRFQLEINIEDKSVYPDKSGSADAVKVGTNPSFRSFRSSNTLMLRDGQTAQFVTAADRISGEVVKIDVTLNVVK